MSLILDALRKSEAERRRGKAPDLLSPGPLLSRPLPRREGRGQLVLIAIAIAAIAAVAWFVFAPAAPQAPAVIAESPAIQDDLAAPAVSPPPPVPAAAPAPVPVAMPRPQPPVTALASAPPLPTTRPVAVSPPPPPTPGAIPDAPIAVAHAPALPGVATLPPEKRSTMPPLKMSMHVWSEQPGERFAIIDGQRVGEGARVPGGVVAEIRRDGVVLDVDGALYLLPRP